MLRPYIDQGRESYRSGTSSASTTVVTMAVTPTTASTGVHDLRVSSSVTPPIFENSQNPLSFIHVPTSDPLAIAVATYAARNGRPARFAGSMAASIAAVVIIATVLQPWAGMFRLATPTQADRKVRPER